MNKAWAVVPAALSLIAGGLISPSPAAAVTPAPIVVNFTGDTAGLKANGFSSAGVPQLFFHDTSGANLSVGDFGVQSHGQGLAVSPDDASALEIRLSALTNAISLAFGNDQPGITNGSDLARLTLFNGVTQVGQVNVNVNADDAMNQTISASGEALFNRATFQYVDAVGTPKNLIETVDDITVSALCTVSGTPGDDNLVGTPGDDVICGDAGDDVISASGGNDLVFGGAGADIVSGGTGTDTVRGQSGDDVLAAGSGNDTATGGSGRDEIAGGSGKDAISGGSGKDAISGGSGNDRVSAGAGNDAVAGGSGKDRLSGGSGRDRISGGSGKDRLLGGTARDRCNGGSGRDTSSSCEIRARIP